MTTVILILTVILQVILLALESTDALMQAFEALPDLGPQLVLLQQVVLVQLRAGRGLQSTQGL